MKKMYKPKIWLIVADIAMIILIIALVLGLFPLTSRTPFQKYLVPAFLFILSWIITSYFFKRYIPAQNQTFEKTALRLFYTVLINFSLFGGFILIQRASPFSQYVLFSILSGIFIVEYLFLFVFFAYRYAVQYDVPPTTLVERENAVLITQETLSKEEKEENEQTVRQATDERTVQFLKENLIFDGRKIKICNDFQSDDLVAFPNYTCSSIIQLKKLNHIRGINKMLFLINEKLPDYGKIVVRYHTKSTTKKNIYKKYPFLIRDIVYVSFYFFHRVIPKFFLTSRFYYDITGGRRRVLSKTEVLGRLVFCGFQIENQRKINDVNIVIAKRIKQSEPIKPRRYYGPLIKLKRHGKMGKMFYVYKMRTMHPYSEFLQGYIHETNQLQEGGKFNKDIRVTSLGRFMRKYWLDELPMLFNLIKGDMKLIGVRPLSMHYFSLYTPELQQKRTQFRPGLLPPFYADMPKSLDEIQASEMKYLKQCEKNGVFVTDTKYFFLILKNILFKKAHSA